MRNLLVKASGTAIAIAAAALLSSGSAYANHNPIPAEGHATVIIDGFNCFFFDDNLALVVVPTPPASLQTVITPSGNTKVSCSGEIAGLTVELPDTGTAVLPTDRAVGFSGPDDGLCGTFLGTTEDWHQVLTKKGRAVVTCHLNAQN